MLIIFDEYPTDYLVYWRNEQSGTLTIMYYCLHCGTSKGFFDNDTDTFLCSKCKKLSFLDDILAKQKLLEEKIEAWGLHDPDPNDFDFHE